MKNQETAKAIESESIDKSLGSSDRGQWMSVWTLEKFHTPNGESIENLQPYEVDVTKGNILVNAGIQLLEDLLMGAGGNAFNNANSYLGVGDSSAAAGATQTDLQAATNKVRKAMEATFPSKSAQTMTFKSIFASGDGNWEWLEWGIFNASTAGTMLNRKVVSKGTKESGDTWTLTVTVTIS